MEAELNHMSPVARDESTLGMQERQIEVSFLCIPYMGHCELKNFLF